MIKSHKKWQKLHKTEKKLFLYGLCVAIKARSYIRFFSIKKYAKWIGKQGDESREYKLGEAQKQQVIFSLKTVKRLKKMLPWKMKCFDEAITFKKLLDKQGLNSTLYQGVTKKGKNIEAHAWVKYGNNSYLEADKQNYVKIIYYS